jgi:PEP-CTERM motif
MVRQEGGAEMRTKHLIAAAALVGTVFAGLGQAHAGPASYMFNSPTGNLGPTQDYASTPPGGGDIVATAEGGSGSLFGTNVSITDQGVGIFANFDNLIVAGSYVQLDLSDLTLPPLTSTSVTFQVSALTNDPTWEVFGTDTPDLDPTIPLEDQGATLILSGTDMNVDTLPDVIGTYLFLDVTVMNPGDNPGILLSQIGIQFVPVVPEPASLALLGTALLGFGVLRRRRR